MDMLKSKIKINMSIRVAMDCGNAAGCITAPQSHRESGITVDELFCDIDGNFPNHHPDPTEDKNLRLLR